MTTVQDYFSIFKLLEMKPIIGWDKHACVCLDKPAWIAHEMLSQIAFEGVHTESIDDWLKQNLDELKEVFNFKKEESAFIDALRIVRGIKSPAK